MIRRFLESDKELDLSYSEVRVMINPYQVRPTNTGVDPIMPNLIENR
jgi:hypothetical protein